MKFTLALVVVTLTGLVTAKKSRDSSEEFAYSYEDDRKENAMSLKGSLNKKFVLSAVLTDRDKSVVCSPISGLMPLAKLALGAEGRSRDELLSAIGVSSKSKIEKKFRKLIRSLQSIPGVSLSIVSRLYLSDKKELKKSFENAANKIFHSCVEQTNFHKPAEAARAINKWVNSETKGMIQTIIRPDEISPSTSIIIANAVYFKGAWVYPFEKTEAGSFYTPWGTQRMTMMKNDGHFKYYRSESLSAQVLTLPYKGHEASLVVVLPFTRDGLPVLLNALKLAPEMLQSAMARMKSTKVKVTLPRFKTETQLDLAVLYEKIGIREVFTHGSGLKNIVKDETVFVSVAIQKAVIEVTEYGTEAAAASVVEGLGAGYKPPDYEETIFNADHPFLYYIMSNQQQLFGGVFNK